MKENSEKEILDNEENYLYNTDTPIIEDSDQEDTAFSPSENIQNRKNSNNKILTYIKNMTSFEKLFWITIFIFVVVYVTLSVMASVNISANDSNSSHNTFPEIIQEVEVLVNSDRIKKNLDNNKTAEEIKKNLKKNMLILDNEIDKEINNAFHSVYQNIDSFLDFHYSVVGEYVELGGMAMSTVEKTIEEKLFGSGFTIIVEDAMQAISNEYEMRLSDHFSFISQKATVDVDMVLNPQIVTDLKQDIARNMKIQGGKIGVLATAAVAPVMAKVAAKKIAAKTSSKIAAKIAIKLTAKTTAATTGAAGGALCGPAFWICSPIAAGVLWFGTDAVVSSIDELYNRDEFKQDIMDYLVDQQNDLRTRLKKSYQKSMQKLSDEILIKYKQTPAKEKIRVKVKEKIGF